MLVVHVWGIEDAYLFLCVHTDTTFGVSFLVVLSCNRAQCRGWVHIHVCTCCNCNFIVVMILLGPPCRTLRGCRWWPHNIVNIEESSWKIVTAACQRIRI